MVKGQTYFLPQLSAKDKVRLKAIAGYQGAREDTNATTPAYNIRAAKRAEERRGMNKPIGSGKRGCGKLKKGSHAAKVYMSRLRAMRK
jgi:hypothetical protein